jgi:hypothetical protein
LPHVLTLDIREDISIGDAARLSELLFCQSSANSAILDITAALYADASAKAIVYRENDRG